MRSAARRSPRSVFIPIAIAMLMAACCLLPARLRAEERARLRVEDYTIDVTLEPQTHKLTARAQVKFVALEDVAILSFELHNALRVQKVTDAQGNVLTTERVLQEGAVRVVLPRAMTKGQETTLTFEYEGLLASVDDSPVPGLRLAYVGDPITVLLYAGRWFPVANFGIDRATARISITAPTGYTVVTGGSVETGASAAQAAEEAAVPILRHQDSNPHDSNPRDSKRQESKKKNRQREEGKTDAKAAAAKPAGETGAQPPPGMTTSRFTWSQPGFPGTVVMAHFTDTEVSDAGMTAHVYFLADRAHLAQQFGDTAIKELGFFITLYGLPQSNQLNLVELPDDSLPTAWAPGIAGIAERYIAEPVNYRLLANAVAHQWFGGIVSPATRNDWWIQDGGARYSEARYIEHAVGEAGAETAVTEMEVGALAYDTVPLGRIGSLNVFDPVFQSMANDKGGMIFHMLRWVMGDEKFDQAMRAFFEQYRDKAAGVAELQKTSEETYGKPLTWFFSQWLNSTGAPEFQNKYTVYRVAKGFRVVGQVEQDLDLFRMPVELKIETDGKTVEKIIDVVGAQSSYTVDTFGRPRTITLDPDNHVLKNSTEMRMRSAILRGQQMVAQGNLAEAIQQLQKAIALNRNSSLAHYRIADVYYLQKNYQAAADSYRDALNGDGEPKWTEVWSHIQLGKIFDITGQRERAVGEYRKALQTNDNTQGALDEARAYLAKPFELPATP
jgi:hypothetical protein